MSAAKTPKKKVKKRKPATPRDLMKIEIAAELGLLYKLQHEGWGGLSAAETGRIGGLLGKKINREKHKPL
jgi:hypothetical protein